jgi:hypothetical protein
MLWMSLRIGCGNVIPLIGLALLGLFGTSAAYPLHQRAGAAEAVPTLLRGYDMREPARPCELPSEKSAYTLPI